MMTLTPEEPGRVHIFFDEQVFLMQRAGGISRYICMLAHHVVRNAGISATVFGGMSRNLHLRRLDDGPTLRRIFMRRRDNWRINTQIERVSRLWRRLTFILVRRRQPAVIYHPSYYGLDSFIARRADATVVTCHDLIPEWLHEQAGRSASEPFLVEKARALRFANAILIVSNATLRDLEVRYPGTLRKAAITPLAACLLGTTPAVPPIQLPARFFLFVGNREGYKNATALLHAFALLAERFPDLGLVFFGGPPFTPREIEWARQRRLDARIRHLSGEDALAVYCYHQAAGLVVPSLYEGFGLPVLEAMQLGCPVISSGSSSLPEVGGDAAVYVDPLDAPALAEAMAQVLTDADWRATLRRKGSAQAARFSWDKTADRTIMAYRHALGRNTATGANPPTTKHQPEACPGKPSAAPTRGAD